MQEKGKIMCAVFLGIVLVGLFVLSSNTVSADAMPYEVLGSIEASDTNYYWLLNVQASDTVLIVITPSTSLSDYSSAVFYSNLTVVNETLGKSNSHSYEFIAKETGNYLLKFWTGGYYYNRAFNYTVKSSHCLTSEPPLVIGTPSQNPARDNVLPDQEVKVSVSVTGGEDGVKNATLFYTINNGTSWEHPDR